MLNVVLLACILAYNRSHTFYTIPYLLYPDTVINFVLSKGLKFVPHKPSVNKYNVIHDW